LSNHVTGKDEFGIGEQEPIIPSFEVSPLLREIYHGPRCRKSEMHNLDPQPAFPNITIDPLEIAQVRFLPAARNRSGSSLRLFAGAPPGQRPINVQTVRSARLGELITALSPAGSSPQAAGMRSSVGLAVSRPEYSKSCNQVLLGGG
jgi:hypothetical protein